MDNDDDCAFERACEWKRFAIIVHSTCTGTKRTSLRVLCTPNCMLSSSPPQAVFPHCIQIPISPQPASSPSDIGLRVRWATLVIRESRSSNALCLGLLLRYCAAATSWTNNTSAQDHVLQPAQLAASSNLSQDSSSSSSASTNLLASR